MADGGGPGSVDFITHASRIPLQLTLVDGSTYRHPGRIIFADRQVNTQTGTIQIVGEFTNSKNLLRPASTRAFRRRPETSLERYWCRRQRKSAARNLSGNCGRYRQPRTAPYCRGRAESWPALGNHIRLETGRTSRCRRRRENAKRRSGEPRSYKESEERNQWRVFLHSTPHRSRL